MHRNRTVVLAVMILAAGLAVAQQAASSSRPGADDIKGFVSSAEFGSSFDSSGHVVKLDTSAGYNLSDHFGVDFGVPFYFVGGSANTATGTKTSFSGSGIGAPYVAARAMYRSESFNYSSRFAVFLPYGNTQAGLSTGQTSVDWNNRFDHTAGRVTPFGEIGLANTVADTSKYNRPYSIFGANVHGQGGAEIEIADKFSVGGSLYKVFPWGTQTLYSRAVPKGSSNLPANANSKSRAFEQSSFVSGTSELGKDSGFSAWGDYTPAPYVTAEVAFNRSLDWALNTVTVGVRFDLGYLAKHGSHK